jgi:hypothetical protein
MAFFKRFFNRKEVPDIARMRGGSAQQTQAEQLAQREHMEAEVAADRKRRGATDIRPGTVPAQDETPGDAAQGEH